MEQQHILAFIDAPDPDNFVMLLALARLNPAADLHIILTGRPIRFGADRTHQTWEYDMPSSRLAQEASALRIKNFLRHWGISVSHVYDGGIAPRTLVPHWVHFAEYYRFLDVDPLQAIRHTELEELSDLIKLVLKWDGCDVVVGGPMTGLAKMLVQHPETADRIRQVHAMFGCWGQVDLMNFGDEPRGAKQFNVACDPHAAYLVLHGLSCPIYLMPTEVTRVASIGFVNAQALRELLPDNAGSRALYHLYALWYDAAVRPRQLKNPSELLFIHDLVGALSLDPHLRNMIYTVVPVDVTDVPHLPKDHAQWGVIQMCPTETSHIFAATGVQENGVQIYLETLKRICA